MKLIYMGCEGAPHTSTHYGIPFTIGVPAEVTNPAVIAKLQGHPHFKVVDDAAPADDKGADGDGDGDADRDALVEQYAAKFGKKPHHKWSAAKIAEALADDKGAD